MQNIFSNLLGVLKMKVVFWTLYFPPCWKQEIKFQDQSVKIHLASEFLAHNLVLDKKNVLL